MNAAGGRERHPVSPEELERERLRTYVEWGRAPAPAWYWPGLAVGISAWLVGIGYGAVWGAGGALLVLIVAFAGVQVHARQTGVSMPRFRCMPGPFRLAYLPALGAGAWLVVALAVVAVTDEPQIVLGAATGPVVALGGAWSSQRCRRAADELATEAGLGR